MSDIDVTIGNDVTMRGGSAASVGRIDQYELVRELGGGGFGCVYLAKDTVAGIEVAVKGLPPEVRHNKEELENIRANFALVSRLHHPNIAAALVLHPAKEVSYANRDAMEKLRVFERDTMMVMEYATGVTLSQWRKQFPEKKVPLEKALAIVKQVAAALDYAHGEKIVHRDVKPSNVMIETKADGSVVARVLDFGLAAEIRSSMGRVSREIRDTSGTRPYMAPEQWRGAKQGPATDQYALAAMFCELVAGEVPFASVFDTGDPVVMLTNVTTLPPELPDSLSRGCRKTLLKALAKKPEERFGSCEAFVDALGGARTPRIAPASQLASLGGYPTVPSGMWLVVALLVVLALAAVGGWWWRERVKSEELRVGNEALAAERARKAAEERKALAAKSDAEKKRKETEIAEREKKLAEERERITKERKADEERRVAEEQRKKEADQRKAEEERKAAEAREAEKRRKEEEARAAEVKRLVAEELARQRKADAEKQEQENRKRAEAKSQDAAAERKDDEARNVRIAEATESAVKAFAAGSWDEGRRLLKDGNADDPRLLYWQGVCAEKGHGVAVNEKMAAYFYQRSAEGGFADAQHKYGLLCFLGRIVEKNVGEAMKWNQKAAENGNVKAQMFLAIQWDSGSVVPRNETKAEKWYRLAAENGNESAKEWLRKKGK